MRVLLVEPDTAGGAVLTAQLTAESLDVKAVATADAALATLADRGIRIVVLGPGLGVDAEGMVQQIRAAGHGVPVVVIVNSDDEAVEVRLLDAGVDDVLPTPYSPKVLVAQIRSLLRRCKPNEAAVLRFEDLTLDLRSLQVMRQGQAISSTSREIAVLEYFLRNPQRVIGRGELSEAIWNEPALPGSNVIEVFIARLRRKVDRPFTVPLIHTIVGRGYMLSVTKPGEVAAPVTAK